MPGIGAPPSEYARLKMFCALVDEYDEIAEAFPVSQRSFTMGVDRQPSDRWHRLVRAMVLRKFILQTDDQMHLSHVARALHECATDNEGDKVGNAISDQLIFLTNIGYGARDGDTLPKLRSLYHVMTDIMYGGFMHGDYDKWRRTENRADLMVERPLWRFTSGAERLIRKVRDAIRALDDAGKLRDDGEPAT